MTTTISISQLEAAINTCSTNTKSATDNYALSADVSVLADLYGRMIYLHQDEVDECDLTDTQRTLLSHIGSAPAPAP